MLFSNLKWVAAGNNFKLQRNGVDATALEQTFSAARVVSHASESLHRTCRCARGFNGQAHSPSHNLPKILDDAERIRGGIAHLAECLAVPGVRQQLDKANPDGVQFAGEVARSYIEALYLAAERQYLLVNMSCRHGVEFDYLSRLHPTQGDNLGEPWAALPAIEEITYNPSTGGCLHSPATLLNRIVQQIVELPEIVPDQVTILLEKEYQRTSCADGELTRSLNRSEAAKWHNGGVEPRNPTDYINTRIGNGTITAPIGKGRGKQYRLSEFPADVRDKVR